MARRILAGLRAPYPLGGRELYMTTSIGVLAGLPVASPSEALRDADLALYAAKNAGKDRVTVFDPALRQAQLERTRLTAGLRQAVEGGELVLNYQPVVDLAGGEIRAVEALLRWSPPGSRPVPPEVFIPIAEETGLIVPIGRWVLEQACADARRWHEQYGISVTVNVSGRQLREEDFTEMVLSTLTRYGLPGERWSWRSPRACCWPPPRPRPGASSPSWRRCASTGCASPWTTSAPATRPCRTCAPSRSTSSRSTVRSPPCSPRPTTGPAPSPRRSWSWRPA
nr:hypothetical protein GCM10020093_106560 [Planobispora longispora]